MTKIDDIDDLLIGGTAEVPVAWLFFDRENPRFVPGKEPESREPADIIANLAAEAELRELIQSISSAGYIGIEPMIVMRDDHRLIVLEGNRRLAAVLSLLHPHLAAAAKMQVPDVSGEIRDTLEFINVHRVESREDAQNIIGFKHINGPRPWDAFAKARFAAQWLKQEQTRGSSVSLREIAERMGDRHNTLRRMVTAIHVIDQASESGIWSVEDRATRRFNFSHLYTGLSYREMTEFLGMAELDPAEDPISNPVPGNRLDALRRLLGWLFGDRREDKEPVIKTQAKSLGMLRRVLASEAATDYLIATADLEGAYREAQPASKLFYENLIHAHARLGDALGSADGYVPEEGDRVRDLVTGIQSRVRSIRAIVEAAHTGRDDE